ncbi:MAG: hypothetical protein ACOCV2_02360 [Persicimonas sp.]
MRVLEDADQHDPDRHDTDFEDADASPEDAASDRGDADVVEDLDCPEHPDVAPGANEGEGNFEKELRPPRRSDEGLREQLLPENSSPEGGLSMLARQLTRMRPHMNGQDPSDAWLYENEPFVFDQAMVFRTDSEETAEMAGEARHEVMAFVNFEPVEFGLIEVDPEPNSECFPTLEDIKAFEDYKYTHSWTSRPNDPRIFTIFLPSDVFDERGIYDVRFLSLNRPEEPGSDKPNSGGHDWPFTVYYHGTDFVSSVDDFEDYDLELTEPPSYLADYVGKNTSALEPPSEVYDPSEYDGTDWEEDMNIAQLYEVPSDTASLHAWIRSPIGAEDQFPRPTYAYAIDDVKPINETRGLTELPQPPSDSREFDDAEVLVDFPFEVPLEEDQMHRIQMLYFYDPFCEGCRPKSRASNLVYMRRGETE